MLPPRRLSALRARASGGATSAALAAARPGKPSRQPRSLTATPTESDPEPRHILFVWPLAPTLTVYDVGLE
jgi:hypothetical protein